LLKKTESFWKVDVILSLKSVIDRYIFGTFEHSSINLFSCHMPDVVSRQSVVWKRRCEFEIFVLKEEFK
jgi:hypothetical protein